MKTLRCRFEIVAITGAGRLPVLALAPLIYRGAHVGEDNVLTAQADKLRLSIHARDLEDFPIDVDGEHLPAAPVLEIEVLRGALLVLA